MHVIPVMQAVNKPIAESSRSPARCTATAGNPEADLTDEAPSRAVDYFAGPLVTLCFVTLGHCTSEEGEAPLFKNWDNELEYLPRKNARLEKQRKIKCLRAQVLGRNTYQHGESQDALSFCHLNSLLLLNCLYGAPQFCRSTMAATSRQTSWLLSVELRISSSFVGLSTLQKAT
jgi:hypothetical protein